ncbi:hypothetical protein [Leptolyngbya sp. 7M]|uniref:hypothetical protein n=1 Tax=Leptolyngbya sp. 7M TaxID=2812896 RepID=UPI001B8AD0C4|nr:hypothetical protein [Leptolyngbya sp. 7M]QYO66057.1 hypothetical protein JVX88_04445 [Leptolyngbya sp. 7M]
MSRFRGNRTLVSLNLTEYYALQVWLTGTFLSEVFVAWLKTKETIGDCPIDP